MSDFDDKLSQLSTLFKGANKTTLHEFLKRAKSDLDRAVNIYLDQEKRKRPLKQPKLEHFFNNVSKKIKLNDCDDIHSTSEEPKKTIQKDNFSAETVANQQTSINKVNLNDALKWPLINSNKSSRRIIQPVLKLFSPQDISEKTPCTLIHDVLPKELANSLLKVMLKESETWHRSQWWLFERMVTSPRTSSFYISNQVKNTCDGDVYYNGKKTSNARQFLPEMEEARKIIMNIVNEKRKIRGEWNPNVAVTNCYANSKESVGWHSDQLTNLGPRPIIASLSLGTTRQFRLRRINEKSSRIISIPLPHNSLLIMWPPCQELWKHEVCSQNVIDNLHPIAGPKRINITFRQFRDEYTAEWTPKCSCGIQCVLKPVMRGTNIGKYFYMCYASGVNEGQKCSFFEWLDVSKRQIDYKRKYNSLESIQSVESL
ncbi:12020_t:CDS:2 [Cetraspora pellucida]|uniref:12020_t:CDS:1 n=1 Tax=Cetraspora pellucida TaxID=1433469 RepID=A0A9N8WEJ5_9GLOM|nr:12020_t:CDS:2 [Cetraspora pellucida]